MEILKIIVTLFIFVAFGLMSSFVYADEEATIKATVQSELVSVSIDKAEINYELIPFNSDKDYPTAITVSNSGNVSEDISIKGSDAVKQGDVTKTWELVAPPAVKDVNKFRHRYTVDGYGTVYYLSKDYPSVNNFKGSINAGVTATLKLALETPTSGNMGTFDTNVYLRAVKH